MKAPLLKDHGLLFSVNPVNSSNSYFLHVFLLSSIQGIFKVVNMKNLLILIITSALLLIFNAKSFAIHQSDAVTPYGDSCARCGHYGTCKSKISIEDAEKAIINYYSKKGLGVEIVKAKGRFIRAKITDKDEEVDVIIFDRNTGRIRSTY